MVEEGNKRPWGYYENLVEAPDHKVKRITVYPKKRLSLQSHEKRSEHWYIISGKGVVSLDDAEVALIQGEAVDIPARTKHRIENTDSEMELIFIEVQTGTYFGEDDIVRYEDDFGRT